MENPTKRKNLIEYYHRIKETSEKPEHIAYAKTMLNRLEKNDKLNFHGSSKPIYDRKRGVIYKNLVEAAEALGVSQMAVSKYMENYGLRVISI